MKLETILTLERNAGRLKDFVTVLAKYGLADWLSHVQYEWIQARLKSSDGQRLGGLSTEARIRLALTELGTTFIKLGQVLSTRPDIVGPELARELAQLQEGVPADPPEVIRATFRSELGEEPEKIFAEFDDEELASASIAQVHRARLKSGQPVVVKIQHQGIDERIHRDLDILLGLAELAEKHSVALRPYQPVATARQFRRVLLRELDFLHEKKHLEQFAHNFALDETVHFPTVYPKFCSRRVLTMELLEGIAGTDEAALQASPFDLDEFARRGANMYLNMIFRDGFYHADPHPGNLMLLEGGVVGVLDGGMIGRLDEQMREDIEGMLLAAVEKQADELTEVVLRVGSVPPDCHRDALRADIAEFVDDYVGQTLEDFDLSAALNGLTDIIRRYHILLPPGLSLLLKVLAMMEGTSRRLDRSFSLAELMEPFYRQSVRRRLSPRKLMHKLQRSLRDWERLIDVLPRDLADIIARVRSGTFNVNLEHRRIETTANRLVLGILTAALFMGSSELWSRQAPPHIAGISVFGALGYLASIVMGYRLLSAIRKSGTTSKNRRDE